MGKKAISEAMIRTKTKPVDWKKLYSGFSELKESREDDIPVKLITKHKDKLLNKKKNNLIHVLFVLNRLVTILI